jgi:hypothetical protein
VNAAYFDNRISKAGVMSLHEIGNPYDPDVAEPPE